MATQEWSTPLKAKVRKSTGKVIFTVFWNTKGPLLIKFLPPKTTINGPYYAILLIQLPCASRKNEEES
jgi:hypothetical protein